MPSTHTSLHYHVVFSTKNRAPLINAEWRSELHRYLGGIVKTTGGTPINIGGVSDHVHMLIGLKPTHMLSDVLRDLKKSSSIWVHERISLATFAWQEGYGAFTVSQSNMSQVSRYIDIQERHHRRKTFQEEYLDLLKKHGIEFDERFLW